MNVQAKFPGAVTVGEAKTTLSKLIARAEAGEEVVISRGNVPVVKLVALAPVVKAPRVPGMYKGEFTVPDSFFDPLPDDELEAWGMGGTKGS